MWLLILPITVQVVRIFTSSTFTDMLMERNTLMEWVYPKIKEYCKEKHGLEFQVWKLNNIWTYFFCINQNVLYSSSLSDLESLCAGMLRNIESWIAEVRGIWIAEVHWIRLMETIGPRLLKTIWSQLA
jgi:hypothetical protein